MKKLPNLDFIRFFLASLVVITHVHIISKPLGLPTYSDSPIFNKASEAVYMFFVLSGFLIVRLIYIEKQNNSFSIKKFYIRRILRIFPLYYLVLIIGFTSYNIVFPYLGFKYEADYNLVEGILMTCFFLPNVFTILYDSGAIMEVLWSLGVEEQFYLIIAPLAFFVKKEFVFQVILGLAVFYFAIFHLDIFWFLQEYDFLYFFLFFGGVISILEEQNKIDFLKKNKVIPLSIISLTLIYYITDFLHFDNKILRNLVACVLLSLFVHTISHNNFGISIRNKFFNYLGKISYGIYMYHVIILYGVLFLFLKLRKFVFFDDITIIVLINILTFVFTILISHFSYKYFETPFLRLKNKFR